MFDFNKGLHSSFSIKHHTQLVSQGDFGPQKVQNKCFLIYCPLLFVPFSFLPYHVLVRPKGVAFRVADFMFWFCYVLWCWNYLQS